MPGFLRRCFKRRPHAPVRTRTNADNLKHRVRTAAGIETADTVQISSIAWEARVHRSTRDRHP